jgi:hypothetical protein
MRQFQTFQVNPASKNTNTTTLQESQVNLSQFFHISNLISLQHLLAAPQHRASRSTSTTTLPESLANLSLVFHVSNLLRQKHNQPARKIQAQRSTSTMIHHESQVNLCHVFRTSSRTPLHVHGLTLGQTALRTQTPNRQERTHNQMQCCRQQGRITAAKIFKFPNQLLWLTPTMHPCRTLRFSHL